MVTVLFETMAFMRKLTQSNEINQTKDLEAEKTNNSERTEEGLAIRDFYEEDEKEYFNKFTSEIYLKGYLICYVEALKLDPDQIIEEYIKLYRNNFEAVKDRNVF